MKEQHSNSLMNWVFSIIVVIENDTR